MVYGLRTVCPSAAQHVAIKARLEFVYNDDVGVLDWSHRDSGVAGSLANTHACAVCCKHMHTRGETPLRLIKKTLQPAKART